MRNIFKLSLLALLVGLPASAFAVDSALPVQLVGTENTETGKYSVPSSNDLATTSYVQGAYNVLGEAINELDVYTGNIDGDVSELKIDVGNHTVTINNHTTSINNLTNAVNALEIPDQGTGTVNVVKSWGGDSEKMDVTVDLSKSTTTEQD